MSINNCDYDFNNLSPEYSRLKTKKYEKRKSPPLLLSLSSSSLSSKLSVAKIATETSLSSLPSTGNSLSENSYILPPSSSLSSSPLLNTASPLIIETSKTITTTTIITTTVPPVSQSPFLLPKITAVTKRTSSISSSSLSSSTTVLSAQSESILLSNTQIRQLPLHERRRQQQQHQEQRRLQMILERRIHHQQFHKFSTNLTNLSLFLYFITYSLLSFLSVSLRKLFSIKSFIIIITLMKIFETIPSCYGLLEDPIIFNNPTVNNKNSNTASVTVIKSGRLSGTNTGGTSSNNHQQYYGNSSISNSGNSPNIISSIGSGGGGRYLDTLDKLERSVAAVIKKVAYGTTSTTKRSIPDNTYMPTLTTIATPPLTTLRYFEKSQHQQQLNLHHRNYELDLERDHALPTSAPNADILKSNSNPMYPNPNRHHNHDRDRHRHVLNSTPVPSIHNLFRKGQPTIPMYPGEMPSYSPPARAFFTPPLPPEYQSPFADKPTLRGTNNDAGIISGGSYINRRPIPPPSLMPGHERIPFRPPDLNSNNSGNGGNENLATSGASGSTLIGSSSITGSSSVSGKNYANIGNEDGQRKKALNTPSQKVSTSVGSNDNYGVGGEHNFGIGGDRSSSSSGDIISSSNDNTTIIGAGINTAGGSTASGGGRLHFPGISRILSGSNGRKEDIHEVLLRKVTDKPNINSPPHQQHPQQTSGTSASSGLDGTRNQNINQNRNIKPGDYDDEQTNNENLGAVAATSNGAGGGVGVSGISSSTSDEDGFDIYLNGASNTDGQDEPKTQPKIKMSTKSTENPSGNGGGSDNSMPNSSGGTGGGQQDYSTQIIHNLANINNEKSLLTTSIPNRANKDSSSNNNGNNAAGSSSSTKPASSSSVATWTVAWNIHVYLSAILFTILGVYSIFKIIFYDKLTHLFNQSYFICIHLILIIICTARIFYLCYDAYNIHSTFHIFISEILLNLPATFLTISFSVLILFLLIRSLNHKNNRYSALIRPLTVVVGSSVHVGLCITLHYVESYTTTHNLYYQQQMMYRNSYRGASSSSNNGASTASINNGGGVSGSNGVGTATAAAAAATLLHNHQFQPPPPPPRVLSLICQIIYIFVCLSLGLLYLYIYRILKRVLRSKSQNYIHGYQNLSYAIHITIATALLFVLLAALQIYGAISISTTRPLITSSSEIDWLQWGYQFSLRLIEIAIITLISWVAGLKTGGTSSVLQREKSNDTHHHNVSGFALFPCTSSSSQEHFETDYPAVCNANTNLHTYTLRTGKPIYDDNFALNSLGGSGGAGSGSGGSGTGIVGSQRSGQCNDFQLSNPNEFVRSYETSSLRSGSGGHHHHHHHHHHHQQPQQIDTSSSHHSDLLTDPQTDHYENPNFELRATNHKPNDLRMIDTCYSEPLNSHPAPSQSSGGSGGYDFQNFERPIYGSERERPNSRNDAINMKMNKQMKSSNNNHLDRLNYENPERRSLNSTHSCANNRNYPSYNSIERRSSGVRKSGTLNNIGGTTHGGRNSSSSNSSLSSRPSGVQTLSSAHNRLGSGNQNSGRGAIVGATNTTSKSFYRDKNHRSSLERSSSAAIQQYMLPSDDDMTCLSGNPERTNLIMSGGGGGGTGIRGDNSIGGISSSTSGGNLTDQLNHHHPQSLSHHMNVAATAPTSAVVSSSNAASSSSGDSATSGSMLVAEHGFVRFRALDDMNNAQGVGIHNASIRGMSSGRNKDKRYTNNT